MNDGEPQRAVDVDLWPITDPDFRVAQHTQHYDNKSTLSSGVQLIDHSIDQVMLSVLVVRESIDRDVSHDRSSIGLHTVGN